MSSDISQLKDVLLASGWEDRADLAIKELDGILCRSYAVVGLLWVSSAKIAIERWLQAQTEFSELRTTLGRDRDLYLLICMQEIEEDAMEELPMMVNDTHTCRKILVELRGRSVEEALSDVPILYWKQSNENVSESEDIAPESLPIPRQVLGDLGKKGASRILDSLLAGEYDVEKVKDEN